MTTFKAVLFDLDDTLFKATKKVWSLVGVRATAAEPFAGTPAPHEVPALLKKQGVKVGVVTSNRRPYAEELLKGFDVPYDVLVTGSDGFEQKPHPATLQHALKQLGVSPAQAAYVGDSGEKDGVAAALAGMQFIGAAWGADASLVSDAGDFHLFEPGLLLDLQAELALAGEAQEKPTMHKGSILRIDTSFALGRHHSPGDARYNSGLTSLVNDLKAGKGIERTAKLIRRGVRWLKEFEGWTPEYGVFIPVWPGKPPRFEAVFDLLCEQEKTKATGVTWNRNGLRVLKEAPSNYKQLKAADRKLAITGAFASGFDFANGHQVLLVDDVHTTGAQTDEAARVLSEGGAEVRVLCITKHQRPRIHGEPCPRCGEGVLVLKPNRRDGSQFWGCSRFKKADCRYTRSA